MILEFVFEVDIIWTHFLHILDNVNGNHSFTLFPFYLINIFNIIYNSAMLVSGLS